MSNSVSRCPWAKSELEIEYHDQQWGVPVHNDKKLFEMLILEGMQAGLSWSTILQKQENMRVAFDSFEPEVIAKYDQKKINELMQNKGIIRNKLKINSLVLNAKAFLKICEEYGSFDKYIWSFVDNKPIINCFEKIEDVPPKTQLSEAMSKSLLKNGFKFVGPTICYAFMQAIGIVNDHLTSCKCYKNSEKH